VTLAADQDLYMKSVAEFVPQLIYFDESCIA
jgi:hypothetical protein